MTTKKKTVAGGPFSAIFLTLALFLVPQILIIFALSIAEVLNEGIIDRVIESSSVGINFALYGVAELLAVTGLIALLKYRKVGLKELGFNGKNLDKWWMIGLAFLAYLGLTLTLLGAASFFFSEDTLNQDQELGFEDATAVWELILAFAALVIIAPVVEEMLFRGYLFQGLRTKWRFWYSALTSAVLFGIAHAQLNVGLDTFALAIPLAYLVEKTGNIWFSIILHAFKNFIAFMLIFVIAT